MAGLDWPVPDSSTLSRRQKTITVELSSRRAAGPLDLLVDSTAIKFLGDGEWLARKHGTHRRRQYCKVHLAMDTGSGDIVAVEFTSSVTVRSDRSAGFWGCRLVCTKDSGHLWCLNDASDKAALDG